MKLFIQLVAFVIAFTAGISISHAQYIEFVENKGQWNSKVNFNGELNGGNFYLQKNGYKVLLNSDADWKRIAEHYSGHKEDAESVDHAHAGNKNDNQKSTNSFATATATDLTLHSHAYEVTFVGANENPQITPEKTIDTYNNYYIGNDPKKWTTGCKLYSAVVYKNIYPDIDVRYYTDNNQLKYDFIVHPGGDISKIVMQYDGVNWLSLQKGNLIIKTSLGNVTELAPLAYHSLSASKTTVAAIYILSGNTVRFKVDAYPKDATLTIDPNLIFLTYTGSKADNWGYTATYDGAGNLYAGGIVFGEGYPITNGAFQTTFGGGDGQEADSPIDIGITKFNQNATVRLYSTYIGGNGDEQPHSLIVDNSGNLVVAGRTTSKNFPSSAVKYGPDSSKGDFDIFIAKFNSLGGFIAGRRIGGNSDDGVNIGPKDKDNLGATSIRQNYGDDARSEVITDAAGNIYLASCTKSSGFPVTSNAFQSKFGGLQDGVFIKTSPDLNTVLCSSYLGGSNNDAAFVLALNTTDNNVFIAGGTASNNFTGVVSGVLHPGYMGGVCDGFISVINNSTYALVKSTYFGTGGTDIIYGIQFDKFGYPYVMGTTSSPLQTINTGWLSEANGKQFISKLKPDLSGFIYSTNFGSGGIVPDISPTAFLVDRCENVYVSGWSGGINSTNYQNGQSSIGLKVTANAFQKTTDGKDFYFFVLKRDASDRLYASFFGQNGGFGDHVDGGTSRFDKQGVIYQAICASCVYDGFALRTYPPNVVGPYDGAGPGAHCNLAALKLAFELAGIGNGVRASIEGREYDTSGCVPLTVDFTDTLALGKQYVWTFGDGSPDTTTLTTNIQHTYNAVGDYRVRLISIDSSTCNIADTAYTTIRARRDKALLSFTPTKLPPCTNLTYQFDNTSQFPPNKPFGSKSFVWDLGDGTIDTAIQIPPHTYKAEGTYIVKLYLIDTNYCNAPDLLTDTLRIAANVKAQFETPPYGCAPYDAVFNNTSLAGQSFVWDFGDGSPTSSEPYPTHHYETPGTYPVTLTATDPETCNKTDQITKTILVSASPVAAFTFGPIPAQENTFTNFYNGSTGANSYRWSFGDGDELPTISRDTVVRHIYNRTDTFTVQLVAYNQYGCTDTDTHRVASIIVPLVDVPNAIAPFGTNRLISVQGYGLSSMDWKIFNRWGKMIFRTTSQKNSWDGTYKGVVQPMEVYTYVLDVQFSDGAKYRKTGDITLIR